jgi:large repetitive protein
MRKLGCLLTAVMTAVSLFAFGGTAAAAGWATPKVICVPWQGDTAKYHTTLSDQPVTLKAVVKTTSTEQTVYYKWVFGDGAESEVSSLSGALRYNVGAAHTYSGAAGTPFTAYLRVGDTAGFTTFTQDPYLIRIEDNTLDAQVNMAIDRGLWYLYTNANTSWYYQNGYLNTIDGSSFMVWAYDDYTVFASSTASAVQAFAINNHKFYGDPDQDPYVEAVRLGMNWLVKGYYSSASSPMLQALSIEAVHGDNPEAGQQFPNAYGIEVLDATYHPIYQGGMVMDAIITSGVLPTDSTGRDFTGRGSPWTYKELLQDMCDMYAAGQYDYDSSGNTGNSSILGGWRYNWGDWPDNSACQWAAIGMIPAQEAPWSCSVPQWVKTYNANWLEYSHYSFNDGLWGGFGYTDPGYGDGTSPSGLVQMAFDGQLTADPKWVRTERYFADNWTSFTYTWNTYYTYNIYGFYAFAKAMRLAQPAPVERFASNNFDWYNGSTDTLGLARIILSLQQPDGHWNDAIWTYDSPLATAWMIVTLKPALFKAAPIACFSAQPTPTYPNAAITFDPSCSGHSETGKTIRNIVKFEWDWNNDGAYDTTTTAPLKVSNAFPCGTLPCHLPVTLKVTDDAGLTKTVTNFIDITDPPHPPVAISGGPYFGSTYARDMLFDASKSYHPDANKHAAGCATCPNDVITAYDWDYYGAPFTYQDGHGKTVYPVYTGSGKWDIGLWVTDNASLAFPGSTVMTDASFSTVTVYSGCIPTITAGSKSGRVLVAWTPGPAGTTYDIYRSTVGPSSTFVKIKSKYRSSTNSYTDTTVINGRKYWYRVLRTTPTGALGCGSKASVAVTPR